MAVTTEDAHACHWCGATVVRRSRGKLIVRLHFCNNECKGNYQRTKKPVTKEWLHEHYIVKGLDTSQIGRMVNRDPKSVWSWLKDLGIPTRPRGGHTSPRAFKKGDVNLFQGRKHTPETRARMREIALADGRVPYDPAVGPYMRGRKGPDATNWKGGISPERQSFYASDEWKAVVPLVYARDKRTCQRCGKVKSRRSEPFDIHHIVSFQCRELRAELSNLVLLCEPCHYWVHGKSNTNGEFILPCP